MFNRHIIMFVLRIMSQCLEIYVINEIVDCSYEIAATMVSEFLGIILGEGELMSM